MIWGYAENGVGFIVGCVSTLRPLFRSRFQLGGAGGSDDGGTVNEREGGADGNRAGRSRGYGDPYYIGDEGNWKTETAVTCEQTSQRGGVGRKSEEISSSPSISGESEEYILQDLRKSDLEKGGRAEKSGNLGGIQVSRSVHQRRD